MAVKVRALVVDDSRIMRTMVMNSLTKTKLADFTFTEAVDGVDALAKFNVAEIDMIFADWNMPNMTGVEFVRKVRAQEGTGHIPVVMVTSEKTMSKIEEALDEAGADQFIIKPFTVEEMERKIKKLIDKVEAHQIREAREAREQAEEETKPRGFFGSLFG